MSGLLSLLDDVAAIAKLAAAQVDDIAGQAAKVGSKVGATVLDDAAKAGAKAGAEAGRRSRARKAGTPGRKKRLV